MSEQATIQVISTGKHNAEIVIKRRGTQGTQTSETRHLWQSSAANGYTDAEGNIYRERGGSLYFAGHIRHGMNATGSPADAFGVAHPARA